VADATKRILFEAVLDDKGVLTGFKQIKEQMDQVKGSATTTAPEVQGLSGAMGALGISMATLAGTTGFLAVVRGMKDITSAFAEAEVSAVRLGAVVRATGGAAGYNTEQLLQMAAGWQRLTGISDEAVQSAETVLLTFKNIGHDIFPQALAASADLAAVMGTDLGSAARSLGMALEDPEQGMLRLRRAGVMLSESVKNTIKDLWEQGRTLEAQNILLAEIQKRVGGAAEALGGTFTASLNKVRVAFSDIKEEMGGFLAASKEGKGTLEDLATVLGMVATKLKEIRDLPGASSANTAAISLVSALLGATPFGPALAQLQQIQLILRGIASTTAPAGIVPALVSSHVEPGVAGGTLNAEAAWKGIEEGIKEAIKAQDKFLEGQTKVTEASFETLKAVGELMTETFAAKLSDRFSVAGSESARKFGDAFRLKSDATILPFAEYVGKNFGMVMGDEIPGGIVSGIKEGIAEASNKEVTTHFGEAFRAGFLTVFQGKGMVDAWKAISQGFAGIFAQSMGNMLDALFQGKTLSEIGQAGGLWTPGKEGEQGKFNWQGAGVMAGGLLGVIGQQTQSRGLATAGGAVSGASMGMQFGPWGALIGAVVGGVIAYLGSKGPSAESAQMGLRGGFGYVTEITGGVNKEAERQVAQEITDRYRTTAFAFRDILHTLGQAVGEMPDITLAFNEKSKNLQSAIQAFISGTVPRAVFEAFKPALELGLASVGVSAGRIAEEMAKFSTGDFDKALVALKEYVTVLIRLRDLHKDLAKSLDDLQTELTASVHDAWKTAADKSLEEIGRLSEGLDQLTSEEQVARANEIADLAENQYKANLQYLQQLYQVQQQLSDSFKQTFLGFEEQKAKGGGAESLGAFYQRQLADLAEQLKATTSPEMLQQIVAQMQKYGTALWQLNLPGIYGSGGKTGWGEEPVGSQAWVEQFLKDQQAAADALLKGWQEEVKAQNDTLLAALAAIGDALTAETVLRQGITKSLGDEEVVRLRLKGVLEDETGAHNALTAAALAAADALAGLGGGGGVEPGARRAA